MENEKILESEGVQAEATQQSKKTDIPRVPCKDLFLQKCNEIYEEWDKTTSRLKKDWVACNGNPYIRETKIHRIEIFRNPNDTQPVDTFENKKVQGASLSTILMASGVALLLSCIPSKISSKLSLKNFKLFK